MRCSDRNGLLIAPLKPKAEGRRPKAVSLFNPMISLADLRARNVSPIWQEAVAVIQELIQTVKATTGSAELLPDLEHIAIIANGDVVALPGSPEPAIPVRHAALMAFTTAGFPYMISAFKWIEEVIAKAKP